MFLRLPLKQTGEYVMFNMEHVIRVDPGSTKDERPGWCRFRHMPLQKTKDGKMTYSSTDVGMSFDEVSMLVSGRWITDPM